MDEFRLSSGSTVLGVAVLSICALKLLSNITLQLFISATYFDDENFSTMYYKHFSAVILFYSKLRTL
jgi:hypothetical protein